MEYRPVVPAGVMPAGLHQDYHAAIPDLSPPRSQGSSTGGASSIGEYAPRMYTPPTPPTPHEDEKVKDAFISVETRTCVCVPRAIGARRPRRESSRYWRDRRAIVAYRIHRKSFDRICHALSRYPRGCLSGRFGDSENGRDDIKLAVGRGILSFYVSERKMVFLEGRQEGIEGLCIHDGRLIHFLYELESINLNLIR